MNTVVHTPITAETLARYYKDTAVLITGGAGFIGSHIATHLVNLGARVTILDNFSTGRRDNIAHISQHSMLMTGDIRDFATCTKAVIGQDMIFHLAAMTTVPESLLHPLHCYQINILGTAHILEAARMQHVPPRIIFSSSAAVYGPYEGVCYETTPCNPISPYGSSKYIGELLCKQYSIHSQVPSVVLRYFNVYGTGQRGDTPYAGVTARLRHHMARGEPISIHGDGQQVRDFIPVEQVAEANIILGMLAHTMQGEVFNIATGTSISLRTLITRLCQSFPEYPVELISFGPERPGDIRFSAADISKYKDLIYHHGYAPLPQKSSALFTML